MNWRRDRDSNPEAAHHDQRFSRPPDSQLSHLSEIDTLGLHSTTLPTFLDKIRLIVKAEREGFEPPDPLLSFLRGSTIASLIKTSYICLRAINQVASRIRCRFSLLFSFTVPITLLYVPMTSITCLPLQGLPTVYSVFP